MISKDVINNALHHISALRNENYVFQKLNLSHRKDAIKLLAKQFQDQQPLSNAFYRSFDLSKHKRLQKWTEFWEMFSEDFLKNDISVGCFDANTGQLIGITVAKDFNYAPQGFQQKYMKYSNFMSSIIHLEQKLIGLVDQKYQPLLKQAGVVMDIWGVALKKQHMGKRLLHKMMLASELLGSSKGYQYSFVYVSNFKTGIALNKLQYDKIAAFDATSFEAYGVRCFQKIQQVQRNSSLFLKKFRNPQNNASNLV